ncbi:MAG: hypothetical protein KAW12_25470 [Candidatus Aminicenantes bacterium]|nr:hypothetical protein [Candidatus Aminicenantes bacterium]
MKKLAVSIFVFFVLISLVVFLNALKADDSCKHVNKTKVTEKYCKIECTWKCDVCGDSKDWVFKAASACNRCEGCASLSGECHKDDCKGIWALTNEEKSDVEETYIKCADCGKRLD